MDPLLILATIIAYFVILFSISYISSRKADNESFFVGNRKSSWYVVAFAMIGSAISGVTFVSVPGMVATNSFAYLQMVIGFAVGQFIIAFVLIPLFYKMNLTSIYEYLENRFGISSYKTGAWFFFISKMLGAAVRLFLVCAVLQFLVFEPFGLPFILNVAVSIALVWLYTYKGGVKTLIWTDSFKTLCLIVSVVMCIYYIASDMSFSFSGMLSAIQDNSYSRIFFFDDYNDKRYFFKQFLAGVFTVIAMTGLDQDFMQKNLSCKNPKDSQKNLITSGVMQIAIIFLFLMLGVLLYMFAASNNITLPEKSDELFPMLATGGYFPVIVGVLFIIGLISAAYAAAGSALTSLTTSFTVDILGSSKKGSDDATTNRRKKVHVVMAIVMGIVIIVINLLNNTSVINAVYVLASYTYGPILGMFAFGIFTKLSVRDKYIPLVAILSPVLCLIIDLNSEKWLNGYSFSYELLIMNAAFTFIGLLLLTKKKTDDSKEQHHS
ncbi:sodium:solute symporter [Dysgonomonas sp. 521]|uniref:sodium:solute symporter n=1 Tax=Dysgonomonas sp. 521 TaxID=2302932 RepID=UPI0013D1605B|nr:sodium:solute symporter [Dysgonomonas sp. 521]NDV97107.1 sodium:solute symporter [Dysgonomonas sp. 521]